MKLAKRADEISPLTPGKIRAKVTISAVKVHGPNSPDVLSGKVKLNHREVIDVSSSEQTIELTEEEVRKMFGDEIADRWFRREGQ
jgi:hypothetical protein